MGACTTSPMGRPRPTPTSGTPGIRPSWSRWWRTACAPACCVTCCRTRPAEVRRSSALRGRPGFEPPLEALTDQLGGLHDVVAEHLRELAPEVVRQRGG